MASKPSGTAAKTAQAAPAAAKTAEAKAAPAATVPTAETPAVSVRQQEYSPGTGWSVGELAPEDRYIEVGPDGAPVKGAKPSAEAPAGKYAQQIAVKGAPVTAAARVQLGLDKA